MAGYKNKLKLTLWVSVVYVLSVICYVPTLLEQNGIIRSSRYIILSTM